MYIFRTVAVDQSKVVFEMLNQASLRLKNKGIDHWQYWQDPPQFKIDWVNEGIHQRQFNFIYLGKMRIGMFRIMDEDLLYWGPQKGKAKYLHSLVILPKYNGKAHGQLVLSQLEQSLSKEKTNYLRLDCSADNHGLCNYYINLDYIPVRVHSMQNGDFQLFEKQLF